MIYQLIPCEKMEDDSSEIILDDFSSGSSAVYLLSNPERLQVVYFQPDEARGTEPRCDYLLYAPQIKLAKFVELKGIDSSDTDHRCCRTSWEHGFHQLEATYHAFCSTLDTEDKKHFILCTALPRKRISTRYTRYTKYLRLREIAQGKVFVLGYEEWDEIKKS